MGRLGLRDRRSRLAASLTTLAACLALGVGLSAAQADQLPDLPPPPLPADTDPGGDGSTSGYPDATTGQAENLFTTEFSNTVESLAADPPDLGSDPRFLNDSTAVVGGGKSPAEFKDQVEQILAQNQGDPTAAHSAIQDLVDAQNAGTPKLVSSTLPLRANDGGGQAPVDLSLDPQGSGYVPDNPLVDLKLPANVSNDVSVGDQGIKVDVGASTNATADTISGGDNLFYHEAAPDTDVVLAPVSVGFETLYQLRSPQSPEDLSMSFTMPSGASLQNSDSGAAQIVKDGQTLATVSAPTATDAAGNAVDVSSSVSGNSLEIHVDHQNANVAYPINVDPVTDVYNGANGGINAFAADWTSSKSTGSAYTTSTSCTQNVSCTSGTTGPRGLYIHAPTNQTYSANQTASWLYFTPHWPTTTAYITGMVLGPIDYNRHSGTGTNPYLAGGILSASNLSWISSWSESADEQATYWLLGPPNQQVAPQGKIAVFQLYTPSSVTLTHWRHAFLSSASLGLADTDNPTLDVDTAPLTSGWIDTDQTTNFQIQAADGGVGVSQVYAPGSNGWNMTTLPNQASPCDGTHAKLCPSSATVTASYIPGQISEGQSEGLAIAWDALGNVAAPTWTMRGDGTPPTFEELSGGLSQAGTGDPYTLHVDATDGKTDDPVNWRSGVRRVQVFLNNDTSPIKDSGLQSCTAQAGSCSLSRDFTFTPSELPTDNLHFKVMATDQLGHTRSQEWDVTLPDTSIPSDSGPTGPTSNPTPHFDYGSTVSGSTFQCRVDGASYTSCPTAGYTTSHLSDGQHTFYVRAINPGGQIDQSAAIRSFTVDTAPPVISTSGGLTEDPASASTSLHVEATDGSSSDPANWQSGARSIQVNINSEQIAETGDHDCSTQEGSCTLSLDYSLVPADWPTNELHIEVIATDQLGQTQTAEWDTTISGASFGGLDPYIQPLTQTSDPARPDYDDSLDEAVPLDPLLSDATAAFGDRLAGLAADRTTDPDVERVYVVGATAADASTLDEITDSNPRVVLTDAQFTFDQIKGAADAVSSQLETDDDISFAVMPDVVGQQVKVVASDIPSDLASAATASADQVPVDYEIDPDYAGGEQTDCQKCFPPYAAGHYLSTPHGFCTSGFTLRRGDQRFATTAGHCAHDGNQMYIATGHGYHDLGPVEQSTPDFNGQYVSADVLRVEISFGNASTYIYVGNGHDMPVNGKFTNHQLDNYMGRRLCFEGVTTGNSGKTCGYLRYPDNEIKEAHHLINKHAYCLGSPHSLGGDSGGPVYRIRDGRNRGTGKAAGLIWGNAGVPGVGLCFSTIGHVEEAENADLFQG
ncbi:MAG: hypothetical protein ACRDMH_05105 [Solirubrobacterales bacterium]